MGLETVELIMDLEDELDLEITEDDASVVSTVGDLRDLLVRKIREKPATPQRKGWCRTQQAFYFIRGAVEGGLGLTRRRSRIRPGDLICRSLTPRHWLDVRRRLMEQTDGTDLPDARRGFLGWPMGHVDEVLTFGDLARRLAASPEPVWGCRPPLGPEPEAIVQDPDLVGQRLRRIIHNEFGIPLDRIRFDSRLYEDLDLG